MTWMAFTDWLYFWRDLVGAAVGIAAVVVAGLALKASRDQIEQARYHEEQHLHSREVAALAVLPLVLSGCCVWITKAAEDLKALVVQGRVDQSLRLKFKPEALPAQHITDLQAMIQSTKDKAVIKRISRVIGQLQIVHARMSGISDHNLTVGPSDIASYISSLTIVYANASSMFEYARGDANTVPVVTWKDVSLASNAFNNHGNHFLERHISTQIQMSSESEFDPESLTHF